jgi:hypothetical protein
MIAKIHVIDDEEAIRFILRSGKQSRRDRAWLLILPEESALSGVKGLCLLEYSRPDVRV